MPARLAKQLFSLVRGVAGVCGHETVTQEDYDRVARVALDCIPAVRRLILRVLAATPAADEMYTTKQVATGVQYSTQTVRRALEDLQALGILTVEKQGQGMPDKWRPLAEWQPALGTLKEVECLLESRRKTTFAEKSEPGVQQNTRRGIEYEEGKV